MLSDYPRREVYPRAPLEFVACEIRYPFAPALEKSTVPEAMLAAISHDLPIPSEENVQTLTLGPGQTSSMTEPRFRFLDRKRTRSAVVAKSAVTIETTSYEEYGDFRALIGEVLSAVRGIAAIVGAERVGLRYINEIRVPTPVNSVLDWKGWIADEIMAVLSVGQGLHTNTLETVLGMVSEPASITLRLAALKGNGVVGNNPLRRRSMPGTGSFFVVDIDSFWESGDNDLLDFDVDPLLDLVDNLHRPVGRIFQSTLTEKLRRELR